MNESTPLPQRLREISDMIREEAVLLGVARRMRLDTPQRLDRAGVELRTLADSIEKGGEANG